MQFKIKNNLILEIFKKLVIIIINLFIYSLIIKINNINFL